MKLDKPLNTTCEVLHELLTKRQISMLDFHWMPGYRTRISDLQLKHNLPLIRDLKEGVNKFKNNYHYAVYRLNPFHKRSALKLYKKLNKK